MAPNVLPAYSLQSIGEEKWSHRETNDEAIGQEQTWESCPRTQLRPTAKLHPSERRRHDTGGGVDPVAAMSLAWGVTLGESSPHTGFPFREPSLRVSPHV